MTDSGKPLYEGVLKYCTRCCMPETQEGIVFDEMGICRACRSSEDKIHIDWVKREQALKKLLNRFKGRAGDNYDCMIPISGGKDSVFQLHVLTQVYGMKPLAVTFNHNWYSETGLYNLHNALEQFNVDHIMFTPNRSLVNRIARKSLGAIGDTCWHCHMGVGAFPLQIAVKFGVKLLIWGDGLSENDGRAAHREKYTRYNRDYIVAVSARIEPENLADEELTSKDLFPFRLPSLEEFEKAGIVGIHLSDYLFWDEERQVEFIKRVYGWREEQVECAYKRYKSVECAMAGIHDYSKFIKRGFGRGTDQASADVRAGLATREEGCELAKQTDTERPEALDYYLKVTGMSETEFIETLKDKREGKAKDLPASYPIKEQLTNEPAKRPAIEKMLERMRREIPEGERGDGRPYPPVQPPEDQEPNG